MHRVALVFAVILISFAMMESHFGITQSGAERSADGDASQTLTNRRLGLAGYPDSNTVVFAPEGEPRFTVTIATDYKCPHCRKLHRSIGSLNEAGVKIRYLLYARPGLLGGENYKTMMSVWCSSDRREAFTRMMAREPIGSLECDNPIAEHYRLAKEAGLTGVPAIFTENGRMLSGFGSAEQLILMLEQDARDQKPQHIPQGEGLTL